MSWVMGRGRGSWVWVNVACVQSSPLPQKKSGEESLLPIFYEGGGTSVHRLGLMSWHCPRPIQLKTTNSRLFHRSTDDDENGYRVYI